MLYKCPIIRQRLEFYNCQHAVFLQSDKWLKDILPANLKLSSLLYASYFNILQRYIFVFPVNVKNTLSICKQVSIELIKTPYQLIQGQYLKLDQPKKATNRNAITTKSIDNKSKHFIYKRTETKSMVLQRVILADISAPFTYKCKRKI